MKLEGTSEGKWVKRDGREVGKRRRVREGIEGGDRTVRIGRETHRKRVWEARWRNRR